MVLPVVWKAGVKRRYEIRDFRLDTESLRYTLNGAPASGAWAGYRSPFEFDMGGTNTDASVRSLLAKDMNVPADMTATVPLANFVMVKDLTPVQKTDFQKFVDIGVALGVVKGAVDTGTIIKGM